MSGMLRLAVGGATGRLGRRIVALAATDPELSLVSALTHEESAYVGCDAGVCAGLPSLGLAVTSAPGEPFDVLIDSSTAEGTERWLDVCLERSSALVIASTGHSPGQLDALHRAARSIPILKAANLGLGANLLCEIASELAQRLGPAFDVEIVETHHRAKKDRPSGTALSIADALVSAERVRPSIHSLRIGTVVGEHAVHFASPDEEIVIQHRALSRDVFARGALRAARWIAGRPPGLYAMRDLLGVGQALSPCAG